MMKLMTLKQYMKMSKPALIRKITKALRAMPKQRLAMVCYNITKMSLANLPLAFPPKSKLPRLRTRKQKALREYGEYALSARGMPMTRRLPKRKTKRKFSRKQLAAQRLFAKRARAGTLKRRRR